MAKDNAAAKSAVAIVADPPRPNVVLLAGSAALWFAWLGFLIWLAWRLS